MRGVGTGCPGSRGGLFRYRRFVEAVDAVLERDECVLEAVVEWLRAVLVLEQLKFPSAQLERLSQHARVLGRLGDQLDQDTPPRGADEKWLELADQLVIIRASVPCCSGSGSSASRTG